MDFPPVHRKEFREHLLAILGIEYDDNMFQKLLDRTTENKDHFNFSIPLVGISIGCSISDHFHCGYSGRNRGSAPDPAYPEHRLKSCAWFHFEPGRQGISFRIFCDKKRRGLWPYEAQISYRDLIQCQVRIEARCKEGRTVEPTRDDKKEVEAILELTPRTPLNVFLRLPAWLQGRPLVRPPTNADYIIESDRASTGVAVSPWGSDAAIIQGPLWLTHQLRADLTVRQYKVLWLCMTRFRELGLEYRFSPLPSSMPGVPRDLPALKSNILTRLQHLSFNIHYMVKALVSNWIINLVEVPAVLDWLQTLPSVDHQERALDALFVGHRRIPSCLQDDLDAIKRSVPPRQSLPHNQQYIWVRTCLVSPWHVQLLPPHMERSNSVLRRFWHHRDRFLRVKFVKEGGPQHISQQLLKIEELEGRDGGFFSRIKQVFDRGISIAGLLYTLCAFGESQIKVHGCWMIAELVSEGFTRSIILDWIGNFRNEKAIAKHAARPGQALSSSSAVKVDVILKEIADIQDPSGRYIFTDGAGLCSAYLLSQCALALGLKDDGQAPSAVQIRIAGAKAVLCATVPKGQHQVAKNEIVLRQSAVKFESSNMGLSALKVSSYSPAYLNRQAIVLLESQGISSTVFERLLCDDLERIESHGLDPLFWASLTFPVARALENGFGNDPLVSNIINLARSTRRSDLKWRARVEVQKGTFLMGVPDQTGQLLEGQIFCQIAPHAGAQEVITKTCVIFRNPCLHSGDVRVVQAVDVPDLRPLINVVVFSTKGARDLPNMLAGGDLDGDQYTVIWDDRLVFQANHAPAAYVAPILQSVQREITVQDTKDVFVEYIKNDVLGIIDNAHLALADDVGPTHLDCVKLAEQHNVAVDSFKTGKYPERPLQTPSKWPDFMGKTAESPGWLQFHLNGKRRKNFPSYESEKALGKMFRLVSDGLARGDAVANIPDFPSIMLDYEQKAREMKPAYDYDVLRLIRAHGLLSEAECVAGVVIRPHGAAVRRLGQKVRDRETAVRDGYAILREKYMTQAREFITQTAHTAPEGGDHDAQTAWAISSYRVAYDETRRDALPEEGGGETASALLGDKRLFSFGWLFADELLQEARRLAEMAAVQSQ